MKSNYVAFALLVAVILALAPVSLRAAETYTVDGVHSYVLFKINHLNIGNSYGRFGNPSGSITWDDANPSKSSFELMVQADNVDTDNENRDKHLRSPEFFNASQHAVISFKSTAVKQVKPDALEINGMLSMLGQTHPITVTARQTGHGKDPWGKYRRGFETTFTIKRSQWGMDFMLSGLSDEVQITVSVEGVRL
jgi:polyisoprenoid-binding protein YceI